MPVDLQHQVRREVGYAVIALGLGLVACSCTIVVCHDFFASPLGQAGTEWHLGQHGLTVAIVLYGLQAKTNIGVPVPTAVTGRLTLSIWTPNRQNDGLQCDCIQEVTICCSQAVTYARWQDYDNCGWDYMCDIWSPVEVCDLTTTVTSIGWLLDSC